MEKNYKLTITYDGSRYYGWERQKNQEWTIQGKLESVLSEMAGAPVQIQGAGRTDAGVHARAMIASARFNTDLTETRIRSYLNHYLPDDICVKDVHVCSDRFHPRYNVRGKTYRYTCYVGDLKPIFDRKYVWTLPQAPDLEAMRKAAAYLTGEHDFASFCGNPRMKKSTIRIVDSIEIIQKSGYLTLTYHGNGFLQYMVRILTGTLIEVGLGKRDPDSMPALLEGKQRALAGATAPAQGLCLIQVDYN